MKTWQLILTLMLASLALSACGSTSNDVPSLAPTPTAEADGESFSNEVLMMNFTECLRDEGLEVADPIVDADGNVEYPEIIDENGVSKETWWEACGYILESFTFEGEKEDRSADLDYYLEVASCMREEGIEIEDPTAETLDTWMGNFKDTTNFDDPDTVTAFETCSGGEFWGGGDEGK
jgi:hypothetical protein